MWEIAQSSRGATELKEKHVNLLLGNQITEAEKHIQTEFGKMAFSVKSGQTTQRNLIYWGYKAKEEAAILWSDEPWSLQGGP